MSNQNTYKHGEHNVICDRCGFKFKSGDVKEEWNGLYVCSDCWEPRHPSDFFRGQSDDPSVEFVRPDDASTEGGTDISGGTIAPTFDSDAKANGEEPDPDENGIPNGTFGSNNSTFDE